MSCNIEEVLKKTTDKLTTAEKGTEKYSTLQTLVNKLKMVASAVSSVAAMPKVIDSLKNGKLIVDSRQPITKTRLTVAEEIKESTSSPNKSPYAQYSSAVSQDTLPSEATVGDTKLNKEYSKLFKDIADRFLKYTVEVTDEVLLDNLRNDINKIVPGDYEPDTNNIRIVSEAVNELELNMAAAVGVDTAAVKELYRLADELPTIQDKTKFVEDATQQQAYKEAISRAVDAKITELSEVLGELDRDKVLVHELVHVAAVKFMATEQTGKKEKAVQDRINTLFADAKKRYLAMGHTAEDMAAEYWAKNVNEFLTEAISNPKTIALLESMKTGKMGRLSTVLRMLVDALAALVSTSKNKDNVYYYTLDGVLAIVENSKANNTAKTQNTATQPLDKLSQNMLVLNNSKAEEIEEALACKNKGK